MDIFLDILIGSVVIFLLFIAATFFYGFFRHLFSAPNSRAKGFIAILLAFFLLD